MSLSQQQKVVRHKRKMATIYGFGFGFIIILLALSNPSESEHRKAVVNYLEMAKNQDSRLYHYESIYKNQTKSDVIFGIFTANGVDFSNINPRKLFILRENYFLFSSTKFELNGSVYYVKGFAALGRVYFFSAYDPVDIIKLSAAVDYGTILGIIIIIFILTYWAIGWDSWWYDEYGHFPLSWIPFSIIILIVYVSFYSEANHFFN